MIRKIARILGTMMVANAIFDFTFPTFATQWFTQGPGRSWRFPGRQIVENFTCLAPTTRRYLAIWEGLIGALLMLTGREERIREALQTTQAPVRIPIQEVRS